MDGGEEVAQIYRIGFDVQSFDHSGILNEGRPEVVTDFYLNSGFSSRGARAGKAGLQVALQFELR